MKFRGLIFANLFRKKLRLTLTIGSFAVALFLFAFLAVVKYAFTGGAELTDARRLVTINRTSIIQPIPLSYRDKILGIPGVQRVSHDNWFGGVYQDEKNFFPQFAIDPENQLQVYPELMVPDDQWNAFLKDRQGATPPAPPPPSDLGGKSATASPSKRAFTVAAHGNSTSTASITANVRRTTRRSSGFSGTTSKREFPRHFKGLIGWYYGEAGFSR